MSQNSGQALPGARVISAVLRERANQQGDQPFVKCGGPWLTFAQLDQRTDWLAAGLAAKGIAKGDRVGVCSANRQEVIEILFALSKLGAINVSFNTFLKGDLLAHQVRDSMPSLLIGDEPGVRAFASLAGSVNLPDIVALDSGDKSFGSYSQLFIAEEPPNVEVTPQDLIALLYTSGTTGAAKGCMLSHGYYTNVPVSYFASGRLVPGDRICTAFPLFHTAGQVIALMSALCGPAELAIETTFSASAFMETASRMKATVLWGVGAMAHAILAQPPSDADATRRFRIAQFQPLDPAAQEEFERRFATPLVAEGYGQTECTPITTGRFHEPRRRSSIGKPVDHLEVALLDEQGEPVPQGAVGEVVVRPRRPGVMFSGYWRRDDATVEAWRDLWHHTGDYARQDEEGYFYFVDRRQDVIRRRGENISSHELESVISRHPDIAEIAVHAVPSDFGEDEVKAVLVPRPGAQLSAQALFDFFKASLPYFSVPRYVHVADSLPRNSLGKTLKHDLRRNDAITWDFEELKLQVPRNERR